MPEFVNQLFAIAMVVLGLGLVIFLHEGGHFIMAKKNKVKVEIFSLGFGPAIWSFRRGETEYRLSWVPLGGYVKMAGENMASEERKGEPWELTSKTPWQRFQIFVAGAVVNLILAFPLAILAFTVGQYREPNEVGSVGTAESHAVALKVKGEGDQEFRALENPADVEALSGIRPGDEIIDVAGRKIGSVHTYRIEMIRRGSGEKVPVTVKRGDQEVVLEVTTGPIPYHIGTAGRGLSFPWRDIKKDSPAERAFVEALEGEGATKPDADGTLRVAVDLQVVSVNGKDVFHPAEVAGAFRSNPNRPVELGIRWQNEDNSYGTATVSLTAPARSVHVIPSDDHLIPAKVGFVVEGTPAFGKLTEGDRIVKIGDRDVQSWADLRAAVEPSARKTLDVRVEGKDSEAIMIRPATSPQGNGVLGIQAHSNLDEEHKYPKLAEVVEGTYFYEMGLRTGDTVTSFDGKPGGIRFTWASEKEPGLMGYRGEQEKTFSVEVKRDGKTVAVDLVSKKQEEGDIAALGLPTTPGGALVVNRRTLYFYRDEKFADAFNAGLQEPVDITVMTFQFLHKLLTGQASPKLLSGPVGIAHASYRFAELHFGNFLWLLCVITVNLGIFNLLPIPVLDGGHNVLLLIEVIRKKFGKPPPSEKFVATFQYVGLLFILGLVVLVTFNDIGRLFG